MTIEELLDPSSTQPSETLLSRDDIKATRMNEGEILQPLSSTISGAGSIEDLSNAFPGMIVMDKDESAVRRELNQQWENYREQQIYEQTAVNQRAERRQSLFERVFSRNSPRLQNDQRTESISTPTFTQRVSKSFRSIYQTTFRAASNVFNFCRNLVIKLDNGYRNFLATLNGNPPTPVTS